MNVRNGRLRPGGLTTAGRWPRRLVLLSLLLSAAHAPAPAHAQAEPDGLQAAVALQQVLVQAIASSEGSVVAIARVRRGPTIDPSETPSGVFPGRGQVPNPGDPDFIPNEFGTGVVVERNLILTSYHVLGGDDMEVEESQYYVTTAARKTCAATIKAADPWSDLAVLEVVADDLAPIKWGETSGLKKGQIVITLGNPYAIARDGQVSASWGIISNLTRKVAPAASRAESSARQTMYHHGALIQVDARLNLGTSGGALLNLKGEMIGLTTSLSAGAGYERAAGYAIAVDNAFRRIVETLKEGREVEYGFLGVAPRNLLLEERLRGARGVRITDVIAATPAAARDGLQPGDIVLQIEQRPIYDAHDLMLYVGQQPVGSNLRLVVQRDRHVVTRSVRLSKKYVYSNRRAIATSRPPVWRGVRVDYSTAVPYFGSGEVDPRGCVAIIHVDPQSAAWRDGLREGMFISHVDGHRVNSPVEFRTAVAANDGPVQVQVCGSRSEPPVRTIQP